MMRIGTCILGGILLFMLGIPGNASAITPEELRAVLDSGEKVTIVDTRRNTVYVQGHIPGAINIPAEICDAKKLPPLGRVIVYDDGVDELRVQEANEALNRKSGISAEIMSGGYPAWEELNVLTTSEPGFQEEKLRYISYEELTRLTAAGRNDVVIVDMRTAASAAPKDAAQKAGGGVKTLDSKFPSARHLNVRKNRGEKGHHNRALGKVLGEAKVRKHQLYILIDDGDGNSEEMAVRLRAAGVRRLAILAGGELALKREGKTGLRTVSQ